MAERLLEAYPDSADPLGLLGAIYTGRGDSERAMVYWRRFLEREPDRVDIYDAMARISLLKEQHDEVIEYCEKALAIQPAVPRIRVHLARSLMGQGRIEAAAAALQREAEISPRSGECLRLLGQARLQLREFEKAKESFQAAIALEPHHEAYYGLATACRRLGERSQATEHMKKFKQLKAANLQGMVDRADEFDDLETVRQAAARSYVDAGEVHLRNAAPSEAAQHWRRAAVLDPKDTAGRAMLATLLMQQGEDREAAGVCEQLVAIDPDNAMFCFKLADLHVRLRRFEAARQGFSRVIELAPQQSAGYRAMAQLLLHTKGSPSEALGFAEAAVQRQPAAENYFVLSQAHSANGDRLAARVAMRQALELEPNNPVYRRAFGSL